MVLRAGDCSCNKLQKPPASITVTTSSLETNAHDIHRGLERQAASEQLGRGLGSCEEVLRLLEAPLLLAHEACWVVHPDDVIVVELARDPRLAVPELLLLS